MVKFLLDTSAALIESITGQVHDVEGIHDRPRAGEFFKGCAFEPVNPSIATISMRSRHVSGWEASQVLKTRLERPGTMSRAGGPLRSWTGAKSKMTVTCLSHTGCGATRVHPRQ